MRIPCVNVLRCHYTFIYPRHLGFTPSSGWERTDLPGDSWLLWLPSEGSSLAEETDVYLKDKQNWGHTQDSEKFIPGYTGFLRAPPAPLNRLSFLWPHLSDSFHRRQRSISFSFKGCFPHCPVINLHPSLLFVYCCVISAHSMTDTPGEKKMVHLYIPELLTYPCPVF